MGKDNYKMIFSMETNYLITKTKQTNKQNKTKDRKEIEQHQQQQQKKKKNPIITNTKYSFKHIVLLFLLKVQNSVDRNKYFNSC